MVKTIPSPQITRIEFGNPILREKAKLLTDEEVASPKTKKLIQDMRYFLTKNKKFGVGLAAPQIGVSKAISVIVIRQTKVRPEVEAVDFAIINPVITKVFGRRSQLWEGCISSGQSPIFAKVPRYKKVELEFTDEQGLRQVKVFSDLTAHVVQHEVDHLNGILFVDKVKDTKSYMTLDEYKKQKAKKPN